MDDHSGNVEASTPAVGSEVAHRAGPSAEIAQDIFCQDCGYNLRGLISDRCPECGRSLGSVRAAESLIPWTKRAELGLCRAYWKTVWVVMFRQARFCDEMARPVSYADSQKFRWLTVFMAYIPIVVLAIVGSIVSWGLDPADLSGDRTLLVTLPTLYTTIGVFLFFALATGAPSYFFHPPEMAVVLQNRAIALSYYASGPLSLTGIPVVAYLISLAFGVDRNFGMGLVLLSIILPLVFMGVWWLDLMHLTRRIMSQRTGWVALVGIAVPTMWLILAGLIVLGILVVELISILTLAAVS